MIAFIKGTIEEVSTDSILIDCNGVGYKVFMPSNQIEKIKSIQGRIKVHTYYYVREDQVNLYGFMDKEGLNMFNMLIGVSGVGPKAALSILSAVPPSSLILSIITEDEKSLCKAQGVGKKMSQRIILELRDKLKNYNIASSLPESDEVYGENETAEALGALMTLGYTKQEAAGALNKIDKSLAIEEKVKQALKLLMRGEV
jgi:Holliday junction DNA helicase RuvA